MINNLQNANAVELTLDELKAKFDLFDHEGLSKLSIEIKKAVKEINYLKKHFFTICSPYQYPKGLDTLRELEFGLEALVRRHYHSYMEIAEITSYLEAAKWDEMGNNLLPVN